MSSSTPAQQSRASSLTERRKAATRMEIARAAAGLFVRHGLRATRAEDIAQAAGIAPRTFYRYFASKEEAVAPLYAAGAERWGEALRAAPADLSVPEALEHAVRHTLTPGVGVSAASWELVRTLIRLTDTSPALRKVWAEVSHDAEGRLGEVLAGRLGMFPAWGSDGDPVRGDGDLVRRDEGPVRGDGDPVRGDAGPVRGDGDPVRGDAGPVRGDGDPGRGADNVGSGPAQAPGLRFAAAVASAAVRVAVEGWAAGEAPASGPKGPAAMALRNLEALRDFPWSDVARA